MPRKLRQWIANLRAAGFVQEPARGSHRKFIHPQGLVVILSGHREGEDAKPYQEKQVRQKISQVQS
jgi:predicted RNA binding protein YcfA (HicA-like mRNA interferase family)